MNREQVLDREYIRGFYEEDRTAVETFEFVKGYFLALKDFRIISTKEYEWALSINNEAYEENKYADIDPDWERE